MLSYEELRERMEQSLSSYRYEHSIGVVKAAIDLARRFEVDEDKAKVAAIIHDCAKMMDAKHLFDIIRENQLSLDEITKQEYSLLHGPVGSMVAQRDFGIKDREIIQAIEFHTTGRANMSKLEKIIYLADYIEECRSYPGVEQLRELAKKNLDEALLLAFENSISYIIKKGSLIHPKTIEARNDILRNIYYNKDK